MVEGEREGEGFTPRKGLYIPWKKGETNIRPEGVWGKWGFLFWLELGGTVERGKEKKGPGTSPRERKKLYWTLTIRWKGGKKINDPTKEKRSRESLRPRKGEGGEQPAAPETFDERAKKEVRCSALQKEKTTHKKTRYICWEKERREKKGDFSNSIGKKGVKESPG